MTAPRRALVTGASSGIGAALAEEYARHGWSLVLTARRADLLEALAARLARVHGVDTMVVAADLSDPAAIDQVLAPFGDRGPDAVINNAGFSRISSFAATPLAEHQAMLQVMLAAPVALARRALPGMLDRRFGRILNVSSVAGFLPATGGDTLYGPIKGFLTQASRGLHLEARGAGVHVTALCPGLTRSGFHDANGSIAQMSRAAPAWMWMSSEAVARAGYAACEANRAVEVPGLVNKAVVGAMKVLPGSLAMAIAGGRARRLGRL